ncbi:MAG: hypothetical protein WA921_00365 [Ahrensia sp.]
MLSFLAGKSPADLLKFGLLVAVLTAITLFLKASVGMCWAFVFLAALWISGNMVAWFGRHPPPPSSYRGGRRDND